MITPKERKRIKGAKARKAATRTTKFPDWYVNTAGVEKYNMPDPSIFKNQAELYRLVPSVASNIDMISKTAATSKIKVLGIEGDERIEKKNHELEMLFERPNEVDSSYEFSVSTTNFRWMAGNCYWWLNKLSEFDKPSEIWVLPPHRIAPVPDGRLGLAGYVYDPGNGQEMALKTWEIIHFKRPNPFNEFIGLSMFEALVVTAMGDIKAREWNTRIFADNNSGRLEGILAFSGQINKTDWEKLQRDVKSASEKREQMMLRGVGKGGVEWMQSKLTPREMEFLLGLDMNEKTITNVLAPGLMSMLAVNSNEANARVGETIFTNKTVWPWLEEKASKINQCLMPLYGDNLIAEHEDIRISDRALELQEMESFSKVHKIDEVRKEYYNAAGIGDERGNLLVAEISASSGEEVAEEITNTPSGSSPDESKPEDIIEEPVKSEMEIDLDKWMRKAVRVGGSVPFDRSCIPNAMKKQILIDLEGVTDKDAIKSVFYAAMDVPVEQNEDYSGLVAMLDNAIKAIDVTPAPVPHVINLTMPMKQDFSVEDITEAVASAVSGVTLPVPVVNIVNDVQPTPIENVVQTGDVIVPEQKTPVVNVDVNLKQVDTMKTTVRRNKEGDVTSLNTKVNNE